MKEKKRQKVLSLLRQGQYFPALERDGRLLRQLGLEFEVCDVHRWASQSRNGGFIANEAEALFFLCNSRGKRVSPLFKKTWLGNTYVAPSEGTTERGKFQTFLL